MSTDRRPTILVGVSGSPASKAALRWAENEAERRHGRLRIVLSWHPEQRAFYAGPARSPDGSGGRERALRNLSATLRAVLGAGPANRHHRRCHRGHRRADSRGRVRVRRPASAGLWTWHVDRTGDPGLPQSGALPGCRRESENGAGRRTARTSAPGHFRRLCRRPRVSGANGALLAVSGEAYPSYSRWHGPLPYSCSVDQLTDGEPVPHRDYPLDVPEARY